MPSTIVVGVDFGTTFSGAAWAISKRPADIHVITNWDAEYNSCSDRGKCPTQLEYGEIDHDTPWGYNIPPEKDSVRWFKLLLLEEKDLPRAVVKSPHFQRARGRQMRLETSAVELAACFLRSFWKHCMENITLALGASEVDSCNIHIAMTVPAIWPHYVQARMRSAADLAGMLKRSTTDSRVKSTTLEFLSEPEAAALAVLAEMHPRPDIKESDTLVVCDAGGGTADLISYQVDKVSSFKLRECVVGEGGLCGGIFVDQNFENLIKEKLEDSPLAEVDSADRRKFMQESWESGIKSQFSGNDRQFHAEVPEGYRSGGSSGKRKRLQTIKLTKDDLLSVFSPVVDKVCNLVTRQENAIRKKHAKPPKFVILVGGFGCCKYLVKRLKEAYPDSTVINPPTTQSWTAVCRGAVRHAIIHKTMGKNGSRKSSSMVGRPGNFLVQSRICRMGYGFMHSITWDPSIHDPVDMYWSSVEQVYKASNQMTWFLEKNKSLDAESSSTHHYYRVYAAGSEPELIEEELFFCTSTVLPSRKNKEVKNLCSIRWNKIIPLKKMQAKYNSVSGRYYVLNYKIQVRVNGSELQIDIYHGKTKVGKGELMIEYASGTE